MTRFARAKGSKASNERLPERATPWNVMKEEMERKKQENEENSERDKLNAIRQKNYDDFLEKTTSEIKTEWVEFPNDAKAESNIIKTKTIEKAKNIKKVVTPIKKSKLTKEMLDMLKPDAAIDAKVENLTSQIVKVLQKEKVKSNEVVFLKKKDDTTQEVKLEIKSKKPVHQKNENDALEEASLKIKNIHVPQNKKNYLPELNLKILRKKIVIQNKEDDAPEEVSSKIETPDIKISKKKNKVKKIKINELTEFVNENNKNISEAPEISSKLEIPVGENMEILSKSQIRRYKKKKRLAELKKYHNEENSEIKQVEEVNIKHVKKQNKNKNKRVKTKKNDINTDRTEVKQIGEVKDKQVLNKGNANNTNVSNKRKNDVPNSNNEDWSEKPNKFAKKEPKLKVAKIRDNEEHQRRKPEEGPIKMIFNGIEVEVVKFDGFPVKKEDAERLKQLRKQMISKGIPRSEVKHSMMLERRKAEKALSREKKKVCFQCRKAGHMLSECPELDNQQVAFSGTGICFKCGSTEHTHFECKVIKTDDYKFASCFICREQGHIARQCPDNPKGLYPEGGACKLCGDVTHLRKDCPQSMKEREDNQMFLKTLSGSNIDSLDDELEKPKVQPMPIKNKIIKF